MNIQAEKLELIEKIIRIEDEYTLEQIRAVLEAFPIPENHRLLLDERLAEHWANSQAGDSWEVVKARIIGKLSQQSQHCSAARTRKLEKTAGKKEISAPAKRFRFPNPVKSAASSTEIDLFLT